MASTLYCADFANIEGRGLAWLAGEAWKLDAFRAYDAGIGPDLYKVAAGGIYSCRVEDVDKDQRQVGKVSELALGYQGGVGAFVTMAATYGLEFAQLVAIYPLVWNTATPANREKANDAWDQRGKRMAAESGLPEKGWVACELVKLAWRDKHPAIVQWWKDLEAAAVGAVESPGEVFRAGPVAYRVHAGHLWCRLPSGRTLCYPFPELHQVKQPWKDRSGNPVYRTALTYEATDQRTKKWGRKSFYGGLGAENVTQAHARDVMAAAMLRVEGAGYPIVLTVHDEILSERAAGAGSLHEFEQLMAEAPPFTAGMPIAVEGWVGHRYRK